MMHKMIVPKKTRVNRRTLVLALVSLVTARPLGVDAASAPGATRLEKAAASAAAPQLHTASTHPMKYYVSLPKNWSRQRQWPVLVAPNAHYGDKGKSLTMFAAARDARKAGFIIVSPLVINADRVDAMTEYRGAVADSISAADAATGDYGRDETARAKFDSEGIRAIIQDIQKQYRGEDKVYMTGFSASTHVAYLFLFTHPELLKGVIVNSGVYLGRGVDEDHIPLLNSPQRSKVEIKFIVGENDPHYERYFENWLETKAQLLRCGHPASKMQTETVKKGNPENLNSGHNWFATRILDFCAAAELTFNHDGNIGQREPDARAAREPVRIGNRYLEVSLEPKDGAITVTDVKTGRVWQQQPLDDKVICRSASAEDDAAIVAQMRDLSNGLDFSARIALATDRPEMSVTLHGDGPLQGYVRYPQPFLTNKGTALVVPMNEGILYPVDDATITPFRLTAHGGHGGISMPWFGVIDQHNGAGVMAILATPDDASIEIARLPQSGLAVRPAWEASWQRFKYDRKIIYTLFDQGGYVAQAKRYREYARQQGLIKTLAQKKAENPNVDRLVGAVNVWNWDMDKLSLCRELKALGMDRVLWSNGGTPQEIREINGLGYLTSRYENLGDLWPTGSPLHLRQEGWPDDLVRMPHGEMHKGWLHWEIEKDGTKKSYQAGVSNSECVLKRARARVPEELKDRPLKCRFEDTTTATWFWEDYSPAHPATRSVDRRWKMALLDYFSGELKLVVGSETGVDAAVPFVHYFEGMLSLVRYRLPDAGRDMVQYKPPTPEFLKFQVGHFYRVPLFELVYHDCVVSHWYWGDYNNKVPEVWDRRDLLNILYGTPPMFMFDQAGWRQHKDRFLQCYRNVCRVSRDVGYDEMLSHEFVSADHAVQRTRFSSGVQILVNLGDTAYALPDGGAIPSMGWLISRQSPDATRASR